MAGRVPAALPTSITIQEVADYTAQAELTGRVGEAVAGPAGGADLVLVVHPEDLPGYRFALARLLVDRLPAGLSLPPPLRDGAALWLSRDWYGRPFSAWVPDLVAADALPAASELLASEPRGDSSGLVATPVAAALVEALPGRTLAEKLAAPLDPARVARELARLGEARGPERREPPRATAGSWSGSPWRGVSFAMLNSVEGGYHAPVADQSLARLSALGANAVSIMPFAGQRGPGETHLRFFTGSPWAETDIGCVHTSRCAHARGMQVLWKPQIWVHGSWPGALQYGDPGSWAAWWASYRRFLLHHAMLAGWAGAEMLCLGVELDGTLGHTEDWRRLIADVRRLYGGRLVYAANWYGGLEAVPFWAELDAMGIDAYYPLSSEASASPGQLREGARAVVARLGAAATRAGKPLLLTEVGFAARKAAWTAPFEEGGELSEADQAASYRALFEALEGERWLKGVFVWKAFSQEPVADRPDFRFLSRPAEGEVRRFFSRLK